MESRAFLCLSGMLLISSITGKQNDNYSKNIYRARYNNWGTVCLAVANEAHEKFHMLSRSTCTATLLLIFHSAMGDGQLGAGEWEQLHPHTPR